MQFPFYKRNSLVVLLLLGDHSTADIIRPSVSSIIFIVSFFIRSYSSFIPLTALKITKSLTLNRTLEGTRITRINAQLYLSNQLAR